MQAIIATGSPEEVAALALAVQRRQSADVQTEKCVSNPEETLREAVQKAIGGIAQGAQAAL